MVILSVDYGDMRTGIAVCDRLEMLASPAGMIKGNYAPKVIDEILLYCEKFKAERIVVGLPKNMDGSEGERAEKCRAFAEALEKASGIQTVLFDERLTTVSAHRILSENNVSSRKRKQVVDSLSAVMILEGYLKSKNQ